MQRLTYTVEYCAVAFRPAVFHFTNILCHLAGALGLYFFAIELLGFLNANEKWRGRIALIASVGWAVHPINSSAVIYISGRADPLAAAFGFAGLYCAMRALRANQLPRALLIITATTSFLLSALSKEIGLIYPVLWLVIVLIGANWSARRNAVAILIFVSVVYLSLRLPAEHIAPPQSHAPVPLLVRPILVARAVAEYAGILIFPRNLYMDRDVETSPTGFAQASVTEVSLRELQTLAGLLLVGGAIHTLVRFRREKAIFVCAILTLLSYLPISGMFRLNATVAEHWLYLPSAFLFLTLGLIVHRFLEKRDVIKIFVPAASLCIALLAARTFLRTFDWKDQRTFLERNISHGGDSSRMLTNLGGLELAKGDFAAAQKHLQLALQKESDQPFALINLAGVEIKQGDYKAAHETLQRAQQSPFVEAKAHELLAVLENKETGKANLLRMRLASRTGPPDWAIEKRYIKVLDEVGYPERAISELKLCLGTQWYRAESWQMLSELLTKTRQSSAAARAHAIARDFDVHL
jgi:tetratricopeptide (TPR) repeat protein